MITKMFIKNGASLLLSASLAAHFDAGIQQKMFPWVVSALEMDKRNKEHNDKKDNDINEKKIDKNSNAIEVNKNEENKVDFFFRLVAFFFFSSSFISSVVDRVSSLLFYYAPRTLETADSSGLREELWLNHYPPVIIV